MIARVTLRSLRLLAIICFCAAALVFVGHVGVTQAAKPQAEAPVDFNRQIRPILSDNCFACHGPDEKQRKAKLRLATRAGALKELRGGGFAIVPGHAAKSELIERVTSADASERMPPPRTNKRLTPQQIELL